ncbi:hypothetical protein OHA25_36910 [Nonomuraea sp. NBC_00507]|uniref:hypothetical protein n=1 Tax=Nonomuraea sp. NBC_00507 TaxID=2976002 RepID=UPI002E196540
MPPRECPGRRSSHARSEPGELLIEQGCQPTPSTLRLAARACGLHPLLIHPTAVEEFGDLAELPQATRRSSTVTSGSGIRCRRSQATD